MNKKERLNIMGDLGEIISVLATENGDRLDEIKERIAKISAKINDGKPKHLVYKVSFKKNGKNFVYVGYTTTELSKRIDSAFSTSAADTGLNKILRELNLTKEEFERIGGKVEEIASFWLEKEARLREKEEIAKAFYDKNLDLLNERCLPKGEAYAS